MDLSIRNQYIIKAYGLGYRSTQEGNIIGKSGKILKLQLVAGYYQFYADFVTKEQPKRVWSHIKVHRFIGYEKYGNLIFEDGLLIRHKDSNPLNNTWDNLLIGNASDNMLDQPEEVRVRKAIQATQFVRKYPDELLKEVFFDRYNLGFTYRDIKEKYGISKSTLSHIFNVSIFSKNYKLCQ
jgi:uncharacterized protein YerC